MTKRILPVPDETSEAYWNACARHVLMLPQCSGCGEFTFPPDITCPNCHSVDPGFAWEEVSGNGTIRTWTVIRHSFLSGFELPFLLVDVQLDAHPGVRLIGRLVDGPDTPVGIGDAVTVTFENLASGVSVPAFKMANGS